MDNAGLTSTFVRIKDNTRLIHYSRDVPEFQELALLPEIPGSCGLSLVIDSHCLFQLLAQQSLNFLLLL